MSAPLHDWVCDRCGRKTLGRRKGPRRCCGMPRRPLGSPWKYAEAKLYERAKIEGPGWLTALPDDYWISEAVLERLQAMVERDGLVWDSSIKRKPDYIQTKTYEELR